jgi:Hint module
MSELRIGDKALSMRPDGSTFFDEIYMFGHKEKSTMASFIRLETDGGFTLRLTPDHHVHVQQADLATWMAVPASKSQVGDLVQVFQGDSKETMIQRIVSKSIVMDRGLFNPYTLGGSLIVDGVLASCHSSWALDGVFYWLGIPIADGYQAVFAPIRALYRLVGPARMASVEFIIDAVADVGNKGMLWPGVMQSSAVAFVSLLALRRLAMKYVADVARAL